LSFVAGAIIIFLGILSLAMHYKNARHKKLGMIVNIIMLAFGVLPSVILVFLNTKSTIEGDIYEATPKVMVCVMDGGWSCNPKFVYQNIFDKNECKSNGGTVLEAKKDKIKFMSDSYEDKQWICVKNS